MNTRLQVEHPVTEAVTGLDLVELMIRVAAGEKLPVAQKDVKLDGWAVEARVYAEDPLRGFLPSIGRLVRYRPPQGPGIRVDTGVFEGGEIGVHYDPMIAKLVGAGATRDEAIDRLSAALDGYVVRGLNHNIAFLAALVRHPRFREGRLSTGFIAEEFPQGFKGGAVDEATLARLIAVAAVLQRRQDEVATAIGGQLPGHEARAPDAYAVRIDGTERMVSLEPLPGGYRASADGAALAVETAWLPGSVLFEATIDGSAVTVQVERAGWGWHLFHAGCELTARVLTPRRAALAALMPVRKPPDTSKFLLSPMPGLLRSIAVKPGQDVKAGEEIAVVEAMKMENILRAERDATVAKLHAAAGDSLAVDQKIVEFA
jgi:propionyl-CoA carboxylase alpha chain